MKGWKFLGALVVIGMLMPEVALAQSPPCPEAPEGMACVPAGTFTRGVDKDPYGGFYKCYQMGRPRTKKSDAVPSAKIWMPTYFMDKYEVTYADFMACVKAGKCNTPKCVAEKRCNKKAGPRYNDFNRPKQPIAGISWYAAVEYCKAQGKHLPTEAEWEKAARGPNGDINPWGNEPATCKRAIIKHPTKGRSCGVKKRSSPSTGRPLVVGSRAPGHYGIYDMIGNIEEYVYDWYSNDWAECGEDCQGKNPKGPCGGADVCPGEFKTTTRLSAKYRGRGAKRVLGCRSILSGRKARHPGASLDPYRLHEAKTKAARDAGDTTTCVYDYTRKKVVRGGSWYWPKCAATGYHRRPHIPQNQPEYHHFGFRCAATPEEAAKLVSKGK